MYRIIAKSRAVRSRSSGGIAQGSGEVSCEIRVNAKVVSRSTATGGYNIAQCEISQDPFTGAWQSDN